MNIETVNMNIETVKQWFIKADKAQHAVQLAEEVKHFVLDKLQTQGFTMDAEQHHDNTE